MSDDDALANASKALTAYLKNNLKTGAITHKRTPEEDVFLLKNLLQYQNTRRRLAKITLVNNNASTPTNLNEKCRKLLNCAMQDYTEELIMKNSFLTETLDKLFAINSENDFRLKKFKEKIVELLKYLQVISTNLSKVQREDEQVLKTILDMQSKSQVQLHEYKKNMLEQRKKFEKEKENISGETYQLQLKHINKRIERMNIMRNVINKLLIFGHIKGEQHLDLLKQLADYRNMYVLESFISKNNRSN